MDEQVYRFIDGQYIPIGCLIDKEVLYSGLWLVDKSSNGLQITNFDYIRQLTKGLNLDDFSNRIDAYECAQKILIGSDFQALLSKPYSLNELVTFVVGKVYEQNQ